MDIAPFYLWMIGITISIGLIVLINYVFNKKQVKPTYNFQDEKRILNLEIHKNMQAIYVHLGKRFRELNPLKLKKVIDESYDLEARSIVSLLNNCETKQEVFMMMDEEFYCWNWTSPLYDEFYDVLMMIADEVWQELNKKD